MDTKWSNEKTLAEHKDIDADVMSINHTGQYVALANPRMLYIIDIDNLSEISRSIPRTSKWNVTASEWNPHQAHLLSLSYNNFVTIYSLRDLFHKGTPLNTRFSRNPNPEILLKGHRRTVTDLNWSPFDQNLLASCSMDTFVNIWDLRDYRKPVICFSSVVGLSQVKWSKSDENILATALEGDIRILDKRKYSTPMHYISAHEQRIHGLDWNPYQGSQFATCSQDGTVKFWELNGLPKDPPIVLPTKLPAWRAKFTPFCNGLITVVVPQLRRAGDINSLWLWNTNNLEQPQHSFFGPTDVVIDFGWRWMPDSKAAELVTWSKDSSLRIWNVDRNILDSFNNQSDQPMEIGTDEIKNRSIFICNEINIASRDPPNNSEFPKSLEESVYSPNFTELSDSPNFNRTIDLKSGDYKDTPDSLRGKTSKPYTSKSNENYNDLTPSVEPLSSDLLSPPDLQEEFALMNLEIPNLVFEELNPINRTCIVCITVTKKVSTKYRLQIKFPPFYPNKVAPIFELLDDSNSDKIRSREIIRILNNTAQRQVKQNRPCLEPCLREIVSVLERKLSASSFVIPNSNTSPSSDYSSLYGSFHDAQVPFPRICGGRFCSADVLVCFGKMPYLHKISDSNERTPRALSDLSAYLQTNYRPYAAQNYLSMELGLSKDNFTISSYPYYCSEERKVRRPVINSDKSRGSFFDPKCGPIYIFKVANLMPCNKSLGEKWILDYKDRVEMCHRNAAISLEANRKDFHLTWSLAGLSVDRVLNSTIVSSPIELEKASSMGNLAETNYLLEPPWGAHPFGRSMIQSLIDFYLKTLDDIQTAAMLCCLFTVRCEDCGKLNCTSKRCQNELYPNYESNSITPLNYPSNESPYHTVTGAPTPALSIVSKLPGEWNFINAFRSLKRHRSNSWSNPVENESPLSSSFHIISSYRINESNATALLRDQREAEKYEIDNNMLDPKNDLLYECVKLLYCDLLMRWGLLDKRVNVMKYVMDDFSQNAFLEKSIELTNYCQNCKKPVQSTQCDDCKKISLKCSLCSVSVRGLICFCPLCGHGGHTFHLYDWFKQTDLCPTGCGCKCSDDLTVF